MPLIIEKHESGTRIEVPQYHLPSIVVRCLHRIRPPLKQMSEFVTGRWMLLFVLVIGLGLMDVWANNHLGSSTHGLLFVLPLLSITVIPSLVDGFLWLSDRLFLRPNAFDVLGLALQPTRLSVRGRSRVEGRAARESETEHPLVLDSPSSPPRPLRFQCTEQSGAPVRVPDEDPASPEEKPTWWSLTLSLADTPDRVYPNLWSTRAELESVRAELQHAIDAALARHGEGETEVPEALHALQQKDPAG
jgi:hypothetical protein